MAGAQCSGVPEGTLERSGSAKRSCHPQAEQEADKPTSPSLALAQALPNKPSEQVKEADFARSHVTGLFNCSLIKITELVLHYGRE